MKCLKDGALPYRLYSMKTEIDLGKLSVPELVELAIRILEELLLRFMQTAK